MRIEKKTNKKKTGAEQPMDTWEIVQIKLNTVINLKFYKLCYGPTKSTSSLRRILLANSATTRTRPRSIDRTLALKSLESWRREGWKLSKWNVQVLGALARRDWVPTRWLEYHHIVTRHWLRRDICQQEKTKHFFSSSSDRSWTYSRLFSRQAGG